MAIVVTLAVLAGCASSARLLRWTLQLAHPSLFARTELVVARVLRGGCDGTDVVYEARIPRRMTVMTPEAPLLGPGVYGLQGFALDADCGWVASDCQEVSFPRDGATALVLRADASPPTCPASLCTPGRCFPGPDAGARDGGVRDALVDAPAVDASIDAPASDARTSPDAAMCMRTMPTVSGASTGTGFLGSVTASGSTITIGEYGGSMPATLTLGGGVTASGSALPMCPEPDAGTCFPILNEVFASGSTITFVDSLGAMHPITLVGATATGSFTMAETGGGALSATVSASGTRITFSTWVFMGAPMTGDIVLSPADLCR